MTTRTLSLQQSLPLIALALFGIWLKVFYNVPLVASAAWGAAIWVYFYIPGRLLLNLLDGQHTGIRGQIHAVALGSAITVPVYSLARLLHWEAAIIPVGILLTGGWIGLHYWQKKVPPQDRKSGLDDLPAFATILFLALLALHFSFFTDIVLTGSGYLARVQLNETFQHLGLINVLTHTYPPFYPYVSGLDFSHYHFYMHLQIEMLNRITGVDTLLLTFFMMPSMYLFLILWLPYTIISHWQQSRILGVAAGAMMLCSNLAWIPAVMGMLSGDYASVWEILLTPTLFGLIVLNGYTPALYIFLLSLLALKEYFVSSSRRQLTLFAVLAYISYGFKSSMGLQLLVTAIVTGTVCWLFSDDKRKGREFTLVSAAAFALLAVNLLLVRKGMGNATISFALLGEYRAFMEHIGKNAGGAAGLLFWPIIYLLLTFGARIAGLGMIRTLFSRSFDPVVMLLILFTLGGVVLAETVTVVSPSAMKNAAVSFSAQSLAAAWLLVPLWMSRYRKQPNKLVLSLCVVAAVSLPTTLQLYKVKHSNEYVEFGKDEIALLDVIKTTPPRSVFLYPIKEAPSSAAHLGGRQSVLDVFESFTPEWAGLDEAKRRHEAVVTYFDIAVDPLYRRLILNNYKVNYVYAPLFYKMVLDNDANLQLAYQNSSYVLYRVPANENRPPTL